MASQAPAQSPDVLASRRGAFVVVSGLALLFVAIRISLLLARDPFFDELYTRWISAKPLRGILDALRYDSGPPLYYFATHLAGALSVRSERVLSLIFATVSFLTIGLSTRLGQSRFLALALLAAFPPAALFAADARSYALCSMFVTFGIVALVGERRLIAALAFVLAAYSHYYGVLFFPVLLLWPGERRVTRESVLATSLAGILYIPGFYLALHQPKEAMGWLVKVHYPETLFPLPPIPLLLLALTASVLAALYVNRFAILIVVPVVIAAVFAASGRSVYFPLRFEAVMAPGLVLWLAASLQRWKRPLRFVIAVTLLAAWCAILYLGVEGFTRRPVDDYRVAASLAASEKQLPIVASGYLYLESVAAGARVSAFPSGQAQHPGWRGPLSDRDVAREVELLPHPPFLWVGEKYTKEQAIVSGHFDARTVYLGPRSVILRVLH